MKRTLLLIIDGLGVGAMPDVRITRPQDIDSNTLRSILISIHSYELPTLSFLGLLSSNTTNNNDVAYRQLKIARGKNALAHYGADTYWGHQEIVGSLPIKPVSQSVYSNRKRICVLLESHGYTTKIINYCIVVNTKMVIADNIEADPGLNFNVIGSLDETAFDEIVGIASLIRPYVNVGRIIAQGGVKIDFSDILRAIEWRQIRDDIYWGVNIAKLRIFNRKFRSCHLGYGALPEKQMPSLLICNGIPVVLLGKAADVIQCPQAVKKPMIATDKVFDLCERYLSRIESGLIVANIQEIDLAGHSQNVKKQAHLLSRVDLRLGKLLPQLHDDDVLIITADHGNDALIGHSQHTREYTPLIVVGKNIRPADLGIRNTMSDIAATICELYGCGVPQNGTSFWKSMAVE